MFKKTEESEWTRFSRALGGRDQSREAEEPIDADDDVESTPTMVGQPAPVEAQPPPPPPPPARTVTSEPEVAPSRSATPYVPPAVVPAPEPAPSPRFAARDESESIISAGTVFEGTFRSEHSVRIYGSVQGEIESQQLIVVERHASVNAKLTAEQVTITGDVNGEVTCPGRVDIMPGGRVTGEISAGSLVMQEGAFFEGHLKMLNRGDAGTDGGPTADDAVAASAAAPARGSGRPRSE